MELAPGKAQHVDYAVRESVGRSAVADGSLVTATAGDVDSGASAPPCREDSSSAGLHQFRCIASSLERAS